MYRTRSPFGPKAQLRLELLEGREVPATIYALSAADHLMTFDSSNPTVLLGNVPITGLSNAGETITDIDVRPGSGGLYGRSTDGLLYLINPLSGQASQIGQAVPTDIGNVGMNFDPVTDRLWVTSNGGQNLAINPSGGTVDSVGNSLTYLPGDFSFPMPARVTAIAFTNSVPLSSSTTEFGIDHVRDTLVAFTGAPGNGQIVTVGSIGIAMKANNVGFDIDPNGNVGYASIQVPGSSYSLFCQINLSTGAATVISPIGPNRLITDIAVARSAITGTGTGLTTTTGATPFGTTVTAGGLTTVSGTSFGGTMFNNPTFNTGLLGGTFFDPTTGSFVTNAALAGAETTTLGSTTTNPLGGTLTTSLGGTLTSPLAAGLTSPLFPGTISGFGVPTASLFPSLVQPLSSAPLASTVNTGALSFFSPASEFVSTTPDDLMSGIFGNGTFTSGTFGSGTPLLGIF